MIPYAKFILLTSAALIHLTACATASSDIKPTIENIIAECVTFSQAIISPKANGSTLNYQVTQLKNIGECGCKSAVIGYYIYSSKNSNLIYSGELPVHSLNSNQQQMKRSFKNDDYSSLKISFSCG